MTYWSRENKDTAMKKRRVDACRGDKTYHGTRVACRTFCCKTFLADGANFVGIIAFVVHTSKYTGQIDHDLQ